MATRRCPKCNLINPGTTITCDCGWSFVEGTMGASRDLPEDHQAGRDRRSRGAGQLGVGVLLVLVGIVITAVTYGSASAQGGGTYIVAYGPIVFGVISIIRGLTAMNS